MKYALAMCTPVLAALICGCAPAASVRPLYSDADLNKPLSEPGIEGEWISPDLDKAGTDEELWLKWKIGPPTRPGQPNSNYPVEFRFARPDPEEGEAPTTYDVRLVRIADKLFFDADFDEQKHGQLRLGRDAILGMAPVHLVGRVWVQKDFLRIAFLDSDWVRDHSSESFREMVDTPDKDTSIITGSTQELRDFLFQNADNPKALAYAVYLCRPGTDCWMQAMNEELRRRPDDKRMLHDGAEFLAKRGDYAKAIELRRRAVLLEPEEAAAHVNLGEALLFALDFAGARKEFNAVPDPTLRKPSACRDITWSYFLEGNWEEAPRAAAACKAIDQLVGPEPILLSYYSQLRLGRKAEAEAYLAQETTKFKGPLTEHALLLRAQDRMDFGYEATKEEQVRNDFFDGLRPTMRSAGIAELRLNSAADKAPKDSLIGLAAKIELERLKAKPKK